MVSSEGNRAHSKEAYSTMSHIFVPAVDQSGTPSTDAYDPVAGTPLGTERKSYPLSGTGGQTAYGSTGSHQHESGNPLRWALILAPSARASSLLLGSPHLPQSPGGGTHRRQGIEKDSTRMRRTRRGRKTPCRKPRQHPKSSKKKGPPSTRARWHWKRRLVMFLCQLFPVRLCVVEDIKARTTGKKRWDQSFSPLEVGKAWFYEELGKLPAVQIKQGYETKQLREQLGLKKTGRSWQKYGKPIALMPGSLPIAP